MRGPIVLVSFAAVAAFGVCPALHAADALPGTADPNNFLRQHCVMCHSQKLHTAGVVLEGIDLSHAGASAPVLERALRKVRTGEMPPPGIPRAPLEVSNAFVKALESALDQAAAEHPNPGRTAIHRLNRAEYSNAIRDLLALDVNAGDMLPVDDSGYGFDNIGDVLSVSPVLLERYMSAARKVARLAAGDLAIKPVAEEFTPAHTPGSKQRNENISERSAVRFRGRHRGAALFPARCRVCYPYQVRAPGGRAAGTQRGIAASHPRRHAHSGSDVPARVHQTRSRSTSRGPAGARRAASSAQPARGSGCAAGWCQHQALSGAAASRRVAAESGEGHRRRPVQSDRPRRDGEPLPHLHLPPGDRRAGGTVRPRDPHRAHAPRISPARGRSRREAAARVLRERP